MGVSVLVWFVLASLGASGGVLLMWDKRVVEAVEDCVGNFSVACLFKHLLDGGE